MGENPTKPAHLLLLLGQEVDDTVVEYAEPQEWRRAGFNLDRIRTLEEAEAADAEVLIVGPGIVNPRRAGTIFRRRHPSGQVLFLVPEAEVDRFRASLPFTPEMAGACVLASGIPLQALQSAVTELLEAGRSNRAVKGLYGRVNAMVEAKVDYPADDDARRQQLVLAERYLATILTHVPEALFASDTRGRIVQLNRAAERLFSTESHYATGMAVSSLFANGSRREIEALVECAAAGEVIGKAETHVDRADGASCIVELSIAPVLGQTGLVEGLSFSAHDITERRKAEEALRKLASTLEERVMERTKELSEANRTLIAEMREREAAEAQIRQMQKMEAVGQLTGGIAHDFNNMLAIIVGSLTMLKRRLDRGDYDVGRFVDAAMEGTERAATLTQRLLAFSRRQPLEPRNLNANKLVAGMSELLRRTLGEIIETETVLAGGLWQTHVDAGQLENALVNLAVNARDAMPSGGRLTIETANCFLDDVYAREHDVPSGQYVMIAVTDTGSGMTPEVAAKAFDPFFTTKEVGKGTGLGLSQVFGFVKQSNGHVKIYSELGQGTTVKIYLPRFYGRSEEASPSLVSGFPASSPSECVLLVEDDGRVRELSAQMLRDLGYDVVEAADGWHALKILESREDIALLFTDVVMPGMNGRELADKAKKMRPHLKILFTTGYTRNAVVHNGVLDPGVHLLPKPATVEQMAHKVRAALDEKDSGFPG